MSTLQEILATNGTAFRDRVPDGRRRWFAFCRLSTKNGEMEISSQTIWAGFSAERPFRELRKPTLVRPDRWRKMMMELYETPVTVKDHISMLAWLLLGGHALVERILAEEKMPGLLLPGEVGRVPNQAGFISIK